MAMGLNDKAWTRVTRVRLLALVALVCAFQFYANHEVLNHGWVDFDDDINIVLNPHLTGGTLDTLQWAWSDAAYNRRYMPLGWLMFDGLFFVGGLNPVTYHAASWLLAAANTIALLLLVRKFLAPNGAFETETGWKNSCAALVTAAFSVHPLRAETIGWPSGLLYLASALLASLAILVDFPTQRPAHSRLSAGLGCLLFLLSLLLYPVCVGLPLVVILAAVSAQPASSWRETISILRAAVRRYASWLGVALVVGAINVFAAAGSRSFSALDNLQQYTLLARCKRSVLMIGHLVAQSVWPGPTSPYYGDLSFAPVLQKLLIPSALLAVVIGLLFQRKTRRGTFFFLLLVLGAILPFSGLLDRGQAASDRYAFILLGVIAVGAARLIVRISSPRGRLLIVITLLVSTISVLSSYRSALAIWRNTDTLQTRLDAVTATHPDVRLSYARPAKNYFLSGRYAESQRLLHRGFARFGAHPELLDAARFIEETRTTLTGDARDPTAPPYFYMHLNLAKMHAAAGHGYAAGVHSSYARDLLRAGAEGKSTP